MQHYIALLSFSKGKDWTRWILWHYQVNIGTYLINVQDKPKSIQENSDQVVHLFMFLHSFLL